MRVGCPIFMLSLSARSSSTPNAAVTPTTVAQLVSADRAPARLAAEGEQPALEAEAAHDRPDARRQDGERGEVRRDRSHRCLEISAAAAARHRPDGMKV